MSWNETMGEWISEDTTNSKIRGEYLSPTFIWFFTQEKEIFIQVRLKFFSFLEFLLAFDTFSSVSQVY